MKRLRFVTVFIFLSALALISCRTPGESVFEQSASGTIPDSPQPPSPPLCPTNYVQVPKNSAVGTNSDFCISKYEMKDVGGVATAQAAGLPWTNVTIAQARSLCADLNALNGVTGKYALVSNPEWMTVARNAELVNSNWSPSAGVQTAGAGVLARGHSDDNPSSLLEAGTDDQPYDGTGNSDSQAGNSGWEQRRTHTLSNGEVIWDMAGNAWEMTDWTVTPAKKAYYAPYDNSVARPFLDWNLIDTLIGENPNDIMLPVTWGSAFVWDFGSNTVRSDARTYLNGIGMYYAHTNATGDIGVRSGSFQYDAESGLFALNLMAGSTYHEGTVGFRCVFRP